jgi:hypothetical protein
VRRSWRHRWQCPRRRKAKPGVELDVSRSAANANGVPLSKRSASASAISDASKFQCEPTTRVLCRIAVAPRALRISAGSVRRAGCNPPGSREQFAFRHPSRRRKSPCNHSLRVRSRQRSPLSAAARSSIDACQACSTECGLCAQECIDAGSPHLASCARLCVDCQDLCAVTATLVSRGSTAGSSICKVCAELCDRCATECDRHESDVMRRCADACRRCAAECRKLASASSS